MGYFGMCRKGNSSLIDFPLQLQEIHATTCQQAVFRSCHAMRWPVHERPDTSGHLTQRRRRPEGLRFDGLSSDLRDGR